MPFNTLRDAPATAYPGQLAEPLAPKFARSARLSAVGSAGMVCVRGPDADDQVRPAFTGDTITPGNLAGVLILSDTRPFEQGSPLAIGTVVSVLRLGSVFLEFENTPTAGDCVTVTLATGAIRAVAQGANAATVGAGRVMIPGLRVVQTRTDAGCAAVEVNLFGAQDNATVGA
jgi:hypothetical protein